jgi:hypothetical protein
MDSFFEKLANSHTGGSQSDHLKLLGRQAARTYLEKEADSPTEAVLSAIEGEDLSRDQIQRVAESTNQALWHTEFHDGGKAETNFEPANAEEIIGQVGVSPEIVYEDAPGLDYYDDVPNQSLPDDFDLADAFGVKVSSAEYEAINPIRKDEIQLQKTAGAVDLSRHAVDLIEGDFRDAGELFYQMVKKACVTDGLGILQVSQAVGQAMQDPAYAASVMQQVGARLEAEGVTFDEKQEMRKLAHPMVVNTDHPLMHQAGILEKLAFSYVQASTAHAQNQEKQAAAFRELRGKLRSQ